MRKLFTIGIFLLQACAILAAPEKDASLFFQQFAEIAQNEMRQNDIPASIKLGQAALESAFGRSELAVKGNNYFGIKCRGNVDCMPTVIKLKDDDLNSEGDTILSTFMAFENPEESFLMHSEFIKSNMKRYGFLFELKPDDYKGWAHGLKKAGYATDPKYAEKLISMIERYELHKYDKQVLEANPVTEMKDNALDALNLAAADPVEEQGEEPTEVPETVLAIADTGSGLFIDDPLVGDNASETTQGQEHGTLFIDEEAGEKPSAPPAVPSKSEIGIPQNPKANQPTNPNAGGKPFKDGFGEKGKPTDVSDYQPPFYKEIMEGGDE